MIKRQKKEEHNMKKFIVEVQDPENGQEVSSGGIREKGKLKAQFKNPVPYEEPSKIPMVVSQQSNMSTRQETNGSHRCEAGRYLLGIVWQEFGEPLLRSGLRKLSNAVINKIESKSCLHTERIASQKQRIIDVEAVELK